MYPLTHMYPHTKSTQRHISYSLRISSMCLVGASRVLMTFHPSVVQPTHGLSLLAFSASFAGSMSGSQTVIPFCWLQTFVLSISTPLEIPFFTPSHSHFLLSSDLWIFRVVLLYHDKLTHPFSSHSLSLQVVLFLHKSCQDIEICYWFTCVLA